MVDYRTEAPEILRDFLAYHETVKAHSKRTVDEYFLDLRNFFRYMKQIRDPALADKQLDEIDSQITQLYERRMEICGHVADYKIKNGKKVLDRTRENEKLAAVSEMASSDFNKKGIRELFEQLMSMSRKLQYQKLSEEAEAGYFPIVLISNGLDEEDQAEEKYLLLQQFLEENHYNLQEETGDIRIYDRRD